MIEVLFAWLTVRTEQLSNFKSAEGTSYDAGGHDAMRNYLLYYSETHPSRVPRSKWQITGFLQGHITCTYCTVSTENIITTRIQIGISSN